jgi:2-hydroxy-3-oxopropionate reductase
MIEQTFQPGFKVKLHRKDLGIALQTGQEVSLPLMTTSLVAELMNALIAQDKGELDHSALALLAGRMSGEG